MKPHIALDELSIKRSLALIEKCEELKLGNICFIYYPKQKNEVKYWLVKYSDHWRLTVIQNWEGKRDVYKIKDKFLIYDYSEED
ncbi:MAG: hypothetical protein ACOYIB_02290 [Desulfosporosinus sp.]|jgi:hypothetical protein